jgi:hypothetical protein
MLFAGHDDWPYILKPFRMRASGLPRRAHYDNPKEIEEMRKAGVTVVHAFDNHVYQPLGGGLTTRGTSLKVGLEADRLYIAAKRTMEYLKIARKWHSDPLRAASHLAAKASVAR